MTVTNILISMQKCTIPSRLVLYKKFDDLTGISNYFMSWLSHMNLYKVNHTKTDYFKKAMMKPHRLEKLPDRTKT